MERWLQMLPPMLMTGDSSLRSLTWEAMGTDWLGRDKQGKPPAFALVAVAWHHSWQGENGVGASAAPWPKSPGPSRRSPRVT